MSACSGRENADGSASSSAGLASFLQRPESFLPACREEENPWLPLPPSPADRRPRRLSAPGGSAVAARRSGDKRPSTCEEGPKSLSGTEGRLPPRPLQPPPPPRPSSGASSCSSWTLPVFQGGFIQRGEAAQPFFERRLQREWQTSPSCCWWRSSSESPPLPEASSFLRADQRGVSLPRPPSRCALSERRVPPPPPPLPAPPPTAPSAAASCVFSPYAQQTHPQGRQQQPAQPAQPAPSTPAVDPHLPAPPQTAQICLQGGEPEVGEIWSPYGAERSSRYTSAPCKATNNNAPAASPQVWSSPASGERRFSSGLSARLARVAVQTAAAQEREWKSLGAAGEASSCEESLLGEAEEASTEVRAAVVRSVAAERRVSQRLAESRLAGKELQGLREEHAKAAEAVAEAERLAALSISQAASASSQQAVCASSASDALPSFSPSPLARTQRAARVALAAVLGFEAEAATASEKASLAEREAQSRDCDRANAAKGLAEARAALDEALASQRAEQEALRLAEEELKVARKKAAAAVEAATRADCEARLASLAAQAALESASASARVSSLRQEAEGAGAEADGLASELREVQKALAVAELQEAEARAAASKAFSEAEGGAQVLRDLTVCSRSRKEAAATAADKTKAACRAETRAVAQSDRRSEVSARSAERWAAASASAGMAEEEVLALRLALREALEEAARVRRAASEASEKASLKARAAEEGAALLAKAREKSKPKKRPSAEDALQTVSASRRARAAVASSPSSPSAPKSNPAVAATVPCLRLRGGILLPAARPSVSARRKRRSSSTKEARLLPTAEKPFLDTESATQQQERPLQRIPEEGVEESLAKEGQRRRGNPSVCERPANLPAGSAAGADASSSLLSASCSSSSARRNCADSLGAVRASSTQRSERPPVSASALVSASLLGTSQSRVAAGAGAVVACGGENAEAGRGGRFWKSVWWEGVGWLRLSEAKLGQGTFGSVFEAEWRSEGQTETEGGVVSTVDGRGCRGCVSAKRVLLALKQYRAQASAPYQFLREEALLRHFNAHVIKPISTRSFREKPSGPPASSASRGAGGASSQGSRVFQLLLPRAHGDLQQLIKKVIINRARAKLLIAWNREQQSLAKAGAAAERGDNAKEGEKAKKEEGSEAETEAEAVAETVGEGSLGEKAELWKVYSEVGPCGLTEFEAKFIFAQLLSGGAFLHLCCESEIARLVDVKLSNLLVFCDASEELQPLKWLVVLADLGSAIVLHPREHLRAATPWKSGLDEKKSIWETQVRQQQVSLTQGTLYTNPPEALRIDACGRLRKPESSPAFPLLPRKRLSPSQQTAACLGATRPRKAKDEDPASAAQKPRQQQLPQLPSEQRKAHSSKVCASPLAASDSSGRAGLLNRRVAADASSFLQSRLGAATSGGADTALLRQQQADSWSFGVTLCELVKGGGCCCPAAERKGPSRRASNKACCVCLSARGSVRFEREAQEARAVMKSLRSQLATTTQRVPSSGSAEAGGGEEKALSGEASAASLVSASKHETCAASLSGNAAAAVRRRVAGGAAESSLAKNESTGGAACAAGAEASRHFSARPSSAESGDLRLRLPSCVVAWAAAHPKYSKFWTAVQELLCHVGFGLFVAPSFKKQQQTQQQPSSEQQQSGPREASSSPRERPLFPEAEGGRSLGSSSAAAAPPFPSHLKEEASLGAEAADEQKLRPKPQSPLWVSYRQEREKEQEDALTAVALRASPRWMGKAFESLNNEERRQLRKLVLAYQLAKVSHSTCAGSLTSRARSLRRQQEIQQHSRCTNSFWLLCAHLLAVDASQRLLLAEALGLAWFAPPETPPSVAAAVSASAHRDFSSSAKRGEVIAAPPPKRRKNTNPGATPLLRESDEEAKKQGEEAEKEQDAAAAAVSQTLQEGGVEGECVFSLIDALEAFSRSHLPCEHDPQRCCRLRYNAAPEGPADGQEASSPSGAKGALPPNSSSKGTAARQAQPLPKGNAFGAIGRRPHAWFAGALEGLQLLGKTESREEEGENPGDSLKTEAAASEAVASVAREEAAVLLWNENHLFRAPGLVLKILKTLRRQRNWTWEDCRASVAAHFVGRFLLHLRRNEISQEENAAALIAATGAVRRDGTRMNSRGPATPLSFSKNPSPHSQEAATLHSPSANSPKRRLPHADSRAVKRLLALSETQEGANGLLKDSDERRGGGLLNASSFKENQAP